MTKKQKNIQKTSLRGSMLFTTLYISMNSQTVEEWSRTGNCKTPKHIMQVQVLKKKKAFTCIVQKLSISFQNKTPKTWYFLSYNFKMLTNTHIKLVCKKCLQTDFSLGFCLLCRPQGTLKNICSQQQRLNETQWEDETVSFSLESSQSNTQTWFL